MGHPLPLFDAVPATASSSEAVGQKMRDPNDYTDFVIPWPASRSTAVGDQGRRGTGDLPLPPEAPAAPAKTKERPGSPAPCQSGLCETQAGRAGGGAIDRASPAILSIIDLRARHHAKGHTPASDQRHGPAFFTNGAKEFIADAFRARSPEKRRGQLVAAAAMLVALIDRDDFAAALAAQQEEADSE